VVKLLGDGVLMRYPTVEAAVRSSLGLLDALTSAGLPPGHAGVHAGPIIVREGDVFGRTVNLASRIADVAGPGQLLVTSAVAEGLPSDRYRLEAVGSAQLEGIGDAVDLVRVQERSAPA
jgi:adenylate cyclase